MAAVNTGLIRNEWNGLSVLVYAARKDAESSEAGLELLCLSACAVKSSPLRKILNTTCQMAGRRDEPDEP